MIVSHARSCLLLAATLGLASCAEETGPNPPPPFVYDTWVFWIAPNTEDSLDIPDGTPGGWIAIDEGGFDATKDQWSGEIVYDAEYYVDQGVDEDVLDSFGKPLRERAGRITFEGTWTWTATADNVHLEATLTCADLDFDTDRPDVLAWECEDYADLEISCRARLAPELIRCSMNRSHEFYLEPEGAR